jgi:hypothetical protein
MKKLSTIIATGTIALIMSAPALAGVSTDSGAVQHNAETIAELQQASQTAEREARDGNKDNFAFVQKNIEINQLIERLNSGQQVAQKQIDNALQPVWVW